MSGIWKYRNLLPPVNKACELSLGEGASPLLRSRNLGRALGLEHLYFKLEMLNPSGSYKDRFAAGAVSHLLQQGLTFCVATSSGNTGAALAAYCAAASIKCFLLIVDGAPAGKLQQMQVYGAETLMIRNFGLDPVITDKVMEGVDALSRQLNTSVQISAFRYSPLGMAGVQTIAYEIAEQQPDLPLQVFAPTGGGGLALALSKGFQTWKQRNPAFELPRLHCVQPEGNDTLVTALRNGLSAGKPVARSLTAVSGLQVPNIIDGDELIPALRLVNGTGYCVTDQSVFDCQRTLARSEGIYCEPAGAVALAGVIEALKKGEIDRTQGVVCLITGHGFKDASSVDRLTKSLPGLYFENADSSFEYILSNYNNTTDKK